MHFIYAQNTCIILHVKMCSMQLITPFPTMQCAWPTINIINHFLAAKSVQKKKGQLDCSLLKSPDKHFSILMFETFCVTCCLIIHSVVETSRHYTVYSAHNAVWSTLVFNFEHSLRGKSSLVECTIISLEIINSLLLFF